MLPRPTTGRPKASDTEKLTSGGLAIATLLTVTVGSSASHAAALALMTVAFVAALLPTLITFPLLAPGGPAGPAGPTAPAGPVSPLPPQPDKAVARIPAATMPNQVLQFFLSMEYPLGLEHEMA